MSPVEFLRTHRFKPFCPICRCLRGSLNCRQFNHFGVVGFDYERGRPIFEHEARP